MKDHDDKTTSGRVAAISEAGMTSEGNPSSRRNW